MNLFSRFFFGAVILLFVSAATSHSSTNLAFKEYITKWEGYTNKPLSHHNGTITIGIGHNCLFGVPYPLKPYYPDEYLNYLYESDYKISLKAARSAVWGFDTLPQKVQFVVLSLIWQLGPTGFNQQFQDFKYALSSRLYEMASYIVMDSDWAKHTSKARLQDHYQAIRFAVDPPPKKPTTFSVDK